MSAIVYDSYTPRSSLFFWVFVFKIIYVCYRIAFEQTWWNVFCLDWERPKYQETETKSTQGDPGRTQSKYDVNAWRQLFLVNELNEI